MAIDTLLLAVGPGDQDRIEQLAETVVEVAVPTDASVDLVHVFDPDDFDDIRERLADSGESGTDLDADQVARRYSTVRELERRIESDDVPVSIHGFSGEDASDHVVELAERGDADRVVVGGRKRSPSGKVIFGSTAQEILLSSPCPVTFVRST
ncbi:MAG: universal stress protein [Halodesulfurarchaeum sp.]